MSDVTKKRVGPIVTLLSRAHPVSHQTIHLKSNYLHRCVKFSGTVFWAWTITRPSVWWPSTHETSPVILPARLHSIIKPRPNRKRTSVRFLIWPRDVGPFHHQTRLLAGNSLCSRSAFVQESLFLQLSSTKKMFPSLNAKKYLNHTKMGFETKY